MKTCRKCDVTKDAEAFRPGRATCRDCNRARQRQRYANDPTPHRRQAQEWARKNPGQRKAAAIARREKNPDHIREQNHCYYLKGRERQLAYQRTYREVNREAVRERARRLEAVRRARKTAVLTIPFTTEQLTQRVEYYGSRCWVCAGAYEELDHVKPLARGGAHILSNLRPICVRCNRSKGSKWPLSKWQAAA